MVPALVGEKRYKHFWPNKLETIVTFMYVPQKWKFIPLNLWLMTLSSSSSSAASILRLVSGALRAFRILTWWWWWHQHKCNWMFFSQLMFTFSLFHHVGSQVFQAWRKFMDEIEQQSKQIRSNAEHLENLCSDRMHQLCQEKKKSRKQYQEEHARIASQFAHVSWLNPGTILWPLKSHADASTSSKKRGRNSLKIPS